MPMSMRVKVLLSLTATVIILISAMYFVTRQTFDPRFATLEMTRVPRVTAQVKDALDLRCSQLADQVRDWSHWTDAESFLRGKSPKFEQRNFPPTLTEDMKLSLIVYADLDGEPKVLRAGAALSSQSKTVTALADELRPGGRLNDSKNNPISGLIAVQTRIFEFAAAPVTNAAGKSPSRGFCLFARELDAAELSNVQASCKHQVQLVNVLETAGQDLLKQCLASATKVHAHADDEHQLSAYTPVTDAWGAPIALSRSVIDREVYTEGRQTVLIVTSELVATVILLSGLTFLLFETLVLSRIGQFSDQLHRLATTADLSTRISLHGSDEMSNLAQPVNTLLASLQSAQQELAEQQQQLSTSERRLSTALTATGDGLWDWNKEDGVYLSPPWFKMLDQPMEKRSFHPPELLQMLSDEDRKIMAAAIAPVRAGTTDQLDADVQFTKTDGNQICVHIRGQVMERDAAGEPLRIVGLAQDVTERRRAEIEMSESRELFRNAFEESATGMAMVSVDGRLMRVNTLFCDIVGYTAEELAGKTFRDITHPDDIAGDDELFFSVLEGKRRHYTMEKRYITKAGAIVWVQLNVGVVVDASTKPMYFVSQIQDITAQKRGQEELHAYAQRLLSTKDELERRSIELADKTIEAELAKRAAEEASGAKSAFLAHMSHEIRTPMTGILGFADLLRQRDVSEADRFRHVDTIIRHGQHLLALMNDTLDISKIEAGKMTLELVECDPIQIAIDVESMLIARAQAKGVRMKVRAAANVPRKIRTDPTRLRQILLNVIGNAIKFSRDEEVGIDIGYVAGNGEAPRVRFVISDTGIGMTPEQIERIFEPYEQADASTTRRFGGTGLGLAISKRLVEMLDGNITVHSEPGEGTQFCITLGTGRRALRAEKPAPAPKPAVPVDTSPKLAGSHILIADDGRDNQYLLSFFLKKAGATLEVADNGREAIEKVQAAAGRGEAFDAILMDIQMPELDGRGATVQLRRMGYTMPILALTAHGTALAREESIAAGCSDHIGKPVDFETLINRVASWIKKDSQPKSELRSAWENEQSFQPVLNDYVAELPMHVTKLLEQLKINDLQALRTTAHQIRGAGGGYGFAELSTAAGQIEESIIEKQLDSIGQNVDNLINKIRSVRGYDPVLETTHGPARTRH